MPLNNLNSAVAYGGSGRPTRQQAEKRQAELLNTAFEMFVADGFDDTTIDAIAKSLGMTKRTIYARYANKIDLFKASVERAIDQNVMPADAFERVVHDDLEAVLLDIARLRIEFVSTRMGRRIEKIVTHAAHRFPEVAALAYEKNSIPVIRYVETLLRREHEAGRIYIDRPELAAAVFLSMTVGSLTRSIYSNPSAKAKAVEERLVYSVKLFMRSLRP